jgi:hypothetical protein
MVSTWDYLVNQFGDNFMENHLSQFYFRLLEQGMSVLTLWGHKYNQGTITNNKEEWANKKWLQT